jgi:hypothetical protein
MKRISVGKEHAASILVGAQVAALTAFFNYALVAKDMYFDMGEVGPHDDLIRYVAWNTCAREALLAVILLWLVAIWRAVYDYRRGKASITAFERYRQPPIVTVTLLLPVAVFVGAFILGLYLPEN